MYKGLFEGAVQYTAEDEAIAARYEEETSSFQPVNKERDPEIVAMFDKLRQKKQQEKSESQVQLDTIKQQIERLPSARQAELEEWLKARHTDSNRATRSPTPVTPVK